VRVLTRYIVRDYLTTFAMAVAIFTFVMCVASLVRAVDLMSRGVSGVRILQYFLLNIPYILQFTVPISTLTTALLMFSRLSLDGEITAMRSCGLSLWQIVAPAIALSVFLSVLSMIFSNYVSPRSRYAQRHVAVRFAEEDPLALLEEGRFVKEFPNLMIYVGSKRRGRLSDIVIYKFDRRGNVIQNVRARSGTLAREDGGATLRIDLYDVRMDAPGGGGGQRDGVAEYYPYRIQTADLFRPGQIRKKISDYSFGELARAIRGVRGANPDLEEEDLAREKMGLLVEANGRMVLSLSCFAFTLLGIPLGLQSHRKESSIGVVVSLVIALLFYVLLTMAKQLKGQPEWRPDLIVWVPIVLAEAVGFSLIQRSN
jgi:lipopolysaccharide export system permease protein